MTSRAFRSHPRAGVWGWALAASCSLWAGCESQSPESHATFSQPREVDAASARLRWDASTAERFGLSKNALAPQAHSSAAPAPATKSQGKSDSQWTTPKGWVELEPTSLRTGNWRVAGDPRAECFLTLLGGDAGGLAANVNRWRTQMGLPAMSREELEGLEQIEFLGGQAPMVNFEGTYTGMTPGGGSGAPQTGYRLVGALKIDPQGSIFMKMTGPSEVIDGEVNAFKELVASLGKPSQDAAGAATSGPASSSAQPQGPAGTGALTWDVPQGWAVAPPNPARVVTLYVDEDREVECYVTSLAGEAGGALANINRWNKQMGAADLSDLAQLERIDMLGTSAYLVEVDGTYSGAPGGPAPASLLGAVLVSPQGSTFVKLIGPSEVIRQQRTAFRAFCASLRVKE